MSEELDKSQAEDTQSVETPGAEEPQVTTPVADAQRGAEKVTPEKTYSHKEWTEREEQRGKGEAAKDREIAGLRKAIAEQALQFEIAQAEDRDKKAVVDGELTEEEATKRSQSRKDDVSRRQTLQQQMAMAQRVMADAEQYGRVLAARDFGEKYGVDPKELLKDPDIKTPEQMELKAIKFEREKLQAKQVAPETYDSGQVGIKGQSLDGMTPEEKILYALNRPQKKK